MLLHEKIKVFFQFVNKRVEQVHRREFEKENNNCTVSNKSCSEQILIQK